MKEKLSVYLFLYLQSDDDSGNDSDSSERSGKRKRFDDDAIERRRNRRVWEENRYSNSFHAGSGNNGSFPVQKLAKTSQNGVILYTIPNVLVLYFGEKFHENPIKIPKL